MSGDPDQILDAIEPFVDAGRQAPQEPELALAAVVAVSGSAGGDAVVADLVRGRGRLRHTTAGTAVVRLRRAGDGGPGRARAPAAGGTAIGVAVAEVRAATRRSSRTSGSRSPWPSPAAAPAGEVWLSATVGALLAGSRVAVEPAGTAPSSASTSPSSAGA